jgi:3-hydroxyethyl bacteriochlorophyllide a dehydrogenase
MKTRAVVFPAPEQIELREVTLTEPGPDEVVVRTLYTSISAGTERMLLAGRLPHPALQFPIVPGYETVGRVVWVGPDADPALEGQIVYVGGARCFVDASPAWGGQAAELVVPAARVVPLAGVPTDQGVLLALAATALHGLDVAGLSAGQRTLVLGQGPVGQIAARLARARGAWVAAADLTASRLARAEANSILDWSAGPSAASHMDPVQVIVEATGSMQALSSALHLLAPGGTVLLLGYYDSLALPYMPLFLKEARLLTAKEWAPGDPARCRDMIASGALRLAPLLTHRLPITSVSEAYTLALTNPDCLKLVLDWSDS